MRPPQRIQIAFRDLKLWIEQRAVDVGRQQPNGRFRVRHSNNFIIAKVAPPSRRLSGGRPARDLRSGARPVPHFSRYVREVGISSENATKFRCHPDESDSSRWDPTNVSTDDAVCEIHFTACSIGSPVRDTQPPYGRTVPQPGFAGFQDDIDLDICGTHVGELRAHSPQHRLRPPKPDPLPPLQISRHGRLLVQNLLRPLSCLSRSPL